MKFRFRHVISHSASLILLFVFYYFQDRWSDVRGRVDKTRQVLEGEIQRRQQMRKDLETIRMWVVKIEVLINSKLTKHEEMDEREIKVCLKLRNK